MTYYTDNVIGLFNYVYRVHEEARARDELRERFTKQFGAPPLGKDARGLILNYMVKCWRKDHSIDNALSSGIDKAFQIIDAELEALRQGKIQLEGSGHPYRSPTAGATAHHTV